MHVIEEILVEFQAQGITASAIERVFDLEQGALKSACQTDNPEIITLLRMVRVYPWLIEVAEHGFDGERSQRILLHNAVDIMMNERHNKNKHKICSHSLIG